MPRRKNTPIDDVRDAGRDMTDGNGLDRRTGKAAAGGAGGVAGAAGGAAIGSVAGPIGTLVGAIAGAAGGWWAGKNVAEKATGFEADDDYYRSRFESMPRKNKDFSYDRAKPVYQLGYLASQNPDYAGRSFDEIEPEIRRGWTDDLSREYGDWDQVRGFASEAFHRSDRVITRSEEELSVGKRPVEAGEVQLRKTVETEHRTERVPVTREEVTVERRPVDDARAAGKVDIGEEHIRVPVTEEEVIVEKRPVVKEEILLRKHAVEDTRTVEADLRKERVEIDDRQKKTRGGKKIDEDQTRPRR
ncbi:MAG TPA: YsnF/AvaK domain-containing protein [Gemmatimonadaceae bacterium]|nr:YsnF/AvaK domain-containing protein [Gemmatimonadaceae bacterium]